jgi:hypothetical protein
MIPEMWQVIGNAAFNDEFYAAMADASSTDLPAEWQDGKLGGGEASNFQALCLPSLSFGGGSEWLN